MGVGFIVVVVACVIAHKTVDHHNPSNKIFIHSSCNKPLRCTFFCSLFALRFIHLRFGNFAQNNSNKQQENTFLRSRIFF